MENHDEDPIANGADLVACLPGITPDLELIVVAAHPVEILFLVESELCLPIVPTVIVVEEQVVVGGDGGQTV